MHNIIQYKNKKPMIDDSAYIDPFCRIIGDVEIGKNVSVWPGAILRGDDGKIIIKKNTAILDHAFLEAPQNNPIIVEQNSIISHGSILHGCKIGKNVLVGIGAIVLDGCTVGDNSIIGAGAVLTPIKKIPARSVVLGMPAKVVKRTSSEEIKKIKEENELIKKKAKEYKNIFAEVVE